MGDVKFRYNTRDFDAKLRRKLAVQPKRAEMAMLGIKNLLVMEVKKRTPVLEGNLTASITGEVIRNRKSWAAAVYVPTNSPAAKYAIFTHENDYNLGAKSVAKNRKTGVVGPKYITRAIEDNRDRIVQIMREALEK